jgi:ATP-dependent DNA ligase
LQAETEDHAKFVVTGTAPAYLLWAMKIKPLWAGFVISAQPVLASRPPSAADWVHETKHDGYRMIVRRDGPIVRLYTRNAYDWTVRLPATAAAAGDPGFTNDGEALAVGPTAFAVPQASSVCGKTGHDLDAASDGLAEAE